MSARASSVVVASAVAAWVVIAVALATVWPLGTYAVSLASFGLLHVASELRYVDARFSRRIAHPLLVVIVILIAGTVLLRLLRLAGLVGATMGTPVELLLVAASCAATLPTLGRQGRAATTVGVVVVAAVAVGACVAPVPTMLTLSILHNATPVGFLVEGAPSSSRARTAIASVALFFGVPLLVASGVVTTTCEHLGAFFPDAAPWSSIGVLRDHLGVYLWPAWREHDDAVSFFSAAVVAQLLHYGAVIVVLPSRTQTDDVPLLRWPGRTTFVVVVMLLAVGLFAHFVVDFAQARLLYGLVAAVHAWLELPVLLLCIGAPWRSSPTSSSSSSSSLASPDADDVRLTTTG